MRGRACPKRVSGGHRPHRDLRPHEPADEPGSPSGGRRIVLPTSFFWGGLWGTDAVPRVPPLILAGSRAPCGTTPSSSNGASSRRAPSRAVGAGEGAPTPGPLPEAGEASHASRAGRGAGESPGWALEIARGRSAVCHDLLESASALGRLGVELGDVDGRLEAERLRLAPAASRHQFRSSAARAGPNGGGGAPGRGEVGSRSRLGGGPSRKPPA